MSFHVHPSTFGIAYFMLMICSISVIALVIARFRSTEFPTRAVTAFQLFFLSGAIASILATLNHFFSLGLSLKVFFVIHMLTNLFILTIWRSVVRVKRFSIYVAPVFLLLVGLGLMMDKVENLLLLMALFNSLFYPFIALLYSRSVLTDRNTGDWIILMSIFMVVLSSFIQVYLLLANIDYMFVYQIRFVSFSIMFVLIGIGFLASLLLNEHETQFALAQTDPLTGALNRRGLENQLANTRFSPELNEKGISVVAIDIDHFKKINDTYGHEAGDKVLAQFARTIENMSRIRDAFARLGGEEFMLVLPDTTHTEAAEIAERARIKIENTPIRLANGEINITSSFGVSGCQYQAPDLYLLMKYADKALYEAKFNGRNRVESIRPE